MSCNILVDLSGSFENNQINCNNRKRSSNYSFGTLNYFKSIRRILYFRRSNILKVLMATVGILLLLFFLLLYNSSASVSTEKLPNEDLNVIETQLGDKNINFRNDNTQIKPSKFTQIPNFSTSTMKERIPLQINHLTLETGQPQYPDNFTNSLSIRDFVHMKNVNVMQVRIREAMKHSWDNYRKYAWGFDMLKPRAKEPDHWFNLGLTIVDSADTLIMMGLEQEAILALDWIENELKFTTTSENSNCFELTIRILAGILSVFHLTARDKLKRQAIEMGDILMHCYDTKSKSVPYSDIDLSSHRAHPPAWNPSSSLSEVSSLQLEFRYLSQISGNKEYERTTFQTSIHIHNLIAKRPHKLLPMYINPNSGELEDSIITLGARTDSYYEYLLKQYLQTGIKWLEEDYLDSIDEIGSQMLQHTNGFKNYTYVAEIRAYSNVNANDSTSDDEIKYINKMDHLICFLPGTLALGYYHFSPLASEYRLKHHLETPTSKLNTRYNSHLSMAEALARTCYHMYSDMGTGLSPEITAFVHFRSDLDPLTQNEPELQAQSSATHNILRPELVESLFYLYHITGLPKYREHAAKIFDSFQKYSRIPSGYTPIADVREKPPSDADIYELLHKNAPDRMESFWLSETLKYLYLIFCDDKYIVRSLLNNYVFNTEAHILPIV